MKKITDIYTDYNIPQNLQRHMLEVASVGSFILDNWNDKFPYEPDKVITELLLHDMGNIIKFDFDNYGHLLGEEDRGRIEYWKKAQKEFMDKWGTSEHEATVNILKDIGVSEDILYIYDNSGSSKAKDLVGSDDWRLKICTYSDMRVSPQGVVSLNERFEEAKYRYKGRDIFEGLDDLMERFNASKELEKQIGECLTMNISNITNNNIAPYLETLKDFMLR